MVVGRTDRRRNRPCDAVVASMEFVGGNRFHLDGMRNEREKNGRVLKSFVAKEFELGEKKGELVFE